MRKIAITVLLSFPLLAKAECHLATPAAIFCASQTSAAEAYEAFGADSNRIRASNARAFLHAHGCLVDESHQTYEQLSETKVATPNEWIPVKTVRSTARDQFLFVASAYLRGSCTPYVPYNGKASSSPPDPSGPTIQHYDTPASRMP